MFLSETARNDFSAAPEADNVISTIVYNPIS